MQGCATLAELRAKYTTRFKIPIHTRACDTMSVKGNNMHVQLTQNGIQEMQRARSEYRPMYFNPSYSNYYPLDGQPIPTYFHRHFVASTFNVTFLLLTSTRLSTIPLGVSDYYT